MNTRETIIDLGTDDRTGKILSESVIQKSLIDQCISEIKNTISATHGLGKNEETEAPLLQSGENVYFIDGTRGAGKTTFMRSLKYKLEEDNDSDIYPLELIDPTKFNAPMGVLVSVISLLNSAVEKTRRNSFDWGNQNNDYNDWQDVLNSLAKGIKSYANNNSKIDSIDDVLRLSMGIDYTFSSLTLSQQCHKLFDKASKIIGCKAFLLTFDDVDTNFSAGWGVLETIRCQLTSSRVVSLITGDIQLYTHLVRGKQFENFSDKLFKYDNERHNERELMVDHLEQQYLLKLFPVENRFRLRTLGQLIKKDQQEINIKNWNCSNKNISLEVVIKDLIAEGLNLRSTNHEYIAEYLNYFIQSPVRLNLQLISRYNNELRRTNELLKVNNTEPLKVDNIKLAMVSNLSTNQPQILNSTLNALMGSSLYKAGIENVELSKLNLSFINNAVFNYSLLEGDLNTGFYLRPNSSKEYLRNISITLASAVAASLTGSISNCLRYMLVALGSVSLFDKRSKIEANKATHHDDEQFKKLFADYMGIGRDESLSNWASHAPACISDGGKTDKGIYPGMLQFNVKNRQFYLKDVKSSDNGYSVFDYKKEKDLAYLTASAASSQSISKNKNSFFSLFSLLAAIDELMNVDVDVDSNSLEEKHFVKTTTVPTVTAPNWSGDVLPDTTEDEDDTDIDAEANDIKLTEITKLWFGTWRKNITMLNVNTKPSALLMGKIWTRLYFNLESITDHHVSRCAKGKADISADARKYSNAAIVMRYKVIALLNAVIFEEDKYHKHDDENSIFDGLGFLANPVSSGKEFSNKIKKLADTSIEELSNQYPIFVSLASCPLIIPFIFAVNGSYNTIQEKKYDKIIHDFFINITLGFNPEFVALTSVKKNKLSGMKMGELSHDEEKVINKVKQNYGFQTLYKAYIAGATRGNKKDSIYK